MGRRSGLLAVAGASILALALLWAKAVPWSQARPEAVPVPTDTILVGATEGRVRGIEPKTRVIHVSPAAANFGATAVTVTRDTRIVVADDQGSFGDLREGTLVKVAYEVRSGIFIARTIEVLGQDGAPAEVAKPLPPRDPRPPAAAAPTPAAASPPPAAVTSPPAPRPTVGSPARPPADTPSRAARPPAASP
ncbi:MAG: hypothetical protein ACREM3_20130, partial [Candidatus Rokuibacteriota bacterium]